MTPPPAQHEWRSTTPCVICGLTGYELSFGGPTICPTCDMGHTPAWLIEAQGKELARLREALREREQDTQRLVERGTALVSALDAVKPKLDAIFVINFARSGVQYTGPTYGEELQAFRDVLVARGVSSGDQKGAEG